MDRVTKEQWKEMFRKIGLTEQQMLDWHRLFEKEHPQGHESFLRWLGLSADEIKKVRSC